MTGVHKRPYEERSVSLSPPLIFFFSQTRFAASDGDVPISIISVVLLRRRKPSPLLMYSSLFLDTIVIFLLRY